MLYYIMNCDSKILILDSRDRQNTADSVTDYNVYLTKPMSHVKSVKLNEISLPYTIYNISSAKNNNRMTIYEENAGTAGADFTITIVDGWYDIESLCGVIKTALDAGGSQTYTVSYDSNTMKVTVTGDAYDIVIYGSDSTGVVTGLESEIGFSIETSEASTVVADKVPKILSPQYLLLNLDFVSDNIDTLDANKNSTFLISTTVNGSQNFYGGMIEKQTEGTKM